MAITGKIQTVFSDKARTKPVFPRTKTTAVSDETGKTLDKILEDITPSPDKIIMDNQGTTLTAAMENVVKSTGGTISSNTLHFKNDTPAPAAGEIMPCITASYQNGDGTYYNFSVMDLVGTAETGNAHSAYVRYGSSNGATYLTSGESSLTMPAVIGASASENLYLTSDGSINLYAGCANDAASYTNVMNLTKSRIDATVPLYGAVWNDYAEFRSSEVLEPGRVIVETGKGDLVLATERLQPGANIISDTYGFSIGETEECKCPIAVSGRVLAYTYEDRDSYAAGDPVCAGPNGTVSKMSREEVCEWPDRIIGTVSEIPTYETWGSGNVEVKNRIWVKVK